MYIPAKGLTPEELVSYESGATLPPPEESAEEEAEIQQLEMAGEARQQMGVRLHPGYELRFKSMFFFLIKITDTCTFHRTPYEPNSPIGDILEHQLISRSLQSQDHSSTGIST